jgi:hypothetical protein
MPTLNEAPTVSLEDVLVPLKTYTFHQVLQFVEGVDSNDLRNQFSGEHVSGAQLLEWHRCSAAKRLRVKSALADRIINARSAVERSLSPSSMPVFDQALAASEESATCGVPESEEDEGDITLESIIREGRWYFTDDLLGMVAGLEKSMLSQHLRNQPQIIGSDFLRFAEAYNGRSGTTDPLRPSPAIIAEIMAERRAARERKAETERQVRAEAQRLLGLYDGHVALSKTADDRIAESNRLRKAFNATHAEELEKIRVAELRASQAKGAIHQANSYVVELTQLVRYWPHLFDRTTSPPRLLERAENK